MNLPNAIADLLLGDFRCVYSMETFNVAEWTFEGTRLNAVNPSAFLNTFSSLPLRDRLVVSASVNSEQISFTSDKPQNAETFLNECQSRQTVAGDSPVATLKVTVSKAFLNNIVSLYSLSAFSKTLLVKKLRERLVTFEVACAVDNVVWVQLFDNTPPFSTKTLIFSKGEPANCSIFPRRQLLTNRYDLCHSGFASLPVVPDDFKLNVSSSNEEFDSILNELCVCTSLIFLADITEPDPVSGSLGFKWNGYKTIAGNFSTSREKISAETSRAWYQIYEWTYSGSGISDKLGLARNIMSLHWRSSITDFVEGGVILSLRSGYEIYLRRNVEQYLAVKNKLNDYLGDVSEKAARLAEGLGDKFEKNVTAFVSFFISSILAKVLTDSSFDGVFNRPVAIIGLVIIAGSALHLCLSIFVFNGDSEHLEDESDNLRRRYSGLLDDTELDAIFDKKTGLDQIKSHLIGKRNLFVFVWIVLLVLAFAVVLALADWRKISKPEISKVTVAGPVQVQIQNPATLLLQLTNLAPTNVTTK